MQAYGIIDDNVAIKENGIPVHPARFPAAIPEYFIRMLTDTGDLVFDPFAGSSSPARSASAWSADGYALSLWMKRIQPRKILRPRLLQFDVIADDADDVRLLLERVREIARVGHGMEWSVGIVRERIAEGNWQVKGGCGKAVGNRIYTMT